MLLSLGLIFTVSINNVSATPMNTIYVNGSHGNNAWSGTSWKTAKLTIKNATGTVSNHGTIHIANGVYKGSGNTNININKNMTIIGQSRTGTIINGTNTAIIFTIKSGMKLVIQNLTLVNGKTYTGYGGAIVNVGTLIISNCTLTHNSATSSKEGGNAGAIYNYGTCTISSSTFTSNSENGGFGGAIYNSGNCTVSSSTFTNNTAYNGDGGAISNFGTLNVTDSTFTGNKATGSSGSGRGGAIYNEIFNQSLANVHFNRIVGNTATIGSAIYNYRGTMNATYNWWGSNNPNFSTMISEIDTDTLTYSPWLYMTFAAAPLSIPDGSTSTLTASFNQDYNGTTITQIAPVLGHIPDGSPVTFTTDLNNVGSKSVVKYTLNGIATAILRADETAGIAHVNGITDSQTLTTNVIINGNILPVVTGSSPANNAFNVALNKVIKITFNEVIKFGHNSWIELKLTNGTGAAVPFTSSITGKVLSITPNSLLDAGRKYTVIIHSNSINDLAGNGLAKAYTTRFTTATAPVVTSTSPVNNEVKVVLNKVVHINFSKPIQFGTNPWIEFKNSSGTTKPFTPTITGSRLNLTTTTPLAKGTKYTVIIHSNSVTDLTGTAGLQSPYTTKFTTA